MSQGPQESKKYASRIWLIIFNILLFFSAGFCIFAGAILTKNGGKADMAKNTTAVKSIEEFGKGTSNTFEKNQFEIFVKDIGIVFIVYGIFLLITSITGLVGACSRNNGMLSFYIGMAVIDFILTVAGLIFSLVSLSNRLRNWSRMDALAWRAASNDDKALAQWVFDCCGFSKGDNLAYKGPALYEGEPTPNKCAAKDSTSSFLGCHDAGQNFWSGQMLFTSISAAISMIIILTLICSASNARRKYLTDTARMKAGSQSGYVNIRDSDRAPLVKN